MEITEQIAQNFSSRKRKEVKSRDYFSAFARL
jgi:hypothetical protein